MIGARHRKVRSFVRRPGRMTTAQPKALMDLMPHMGIEFIDRKIDLEKIFGRNAEKALDIGFGDGEALVLALPRLRPCFPLDRVSFSEPILPTLSQ